jgi:hypothetical protein
MGFNSAFKGLMIFTDIAWFLLNRSRKMTGYIHKRKHELLPQPGLFVFIFRFIRLRKTHAIESL